mmetsp:Transcript_51646/g.120908  ORF Transcript_51646/g.120908 Transcript_51646/m.120908 type:complete len:494 (+) Transcript_51646:87-1568(+)
MCAKALSPSGFRPKGDGLRSGQPGAQSAQDEHRPGLQVKDVPVTQSSSSWDGLSQVMSYRGLTYAVGQQVEVLRSSGAWAPGRVSQVDPDGSVTVRILVHQPLCGHPVPKKTCRGQEVELFIRPARVDITSSSQLAETEPSLIPPPIPLGQCSQKIDACSSAGTEIETETTASSSGLPRSVLQDQQSDATSAQTAKGQVSSEGSKNKVEPTTVAETMHHVASWLGIQSARNPSSATGDTVAAAPEIGKSAQGDASSLASSASEASASQAVAIGGEDNRDGLATSQGLQVHLGVIEFGVGGSLGLSSLFDQVSFRVSLLAGRPVARWTEGLICTGALGLKYSRIVCQDGRYVPKIICEVNQVLVLPWSAEENEIAGTPTQLVADIWLERTCIIDRLDHMMSTLGLTNSAATLERLWVGRAVVTGTCAGKELYPWPVEGPQFGSIGIGEKPHYHLAECQAAASVDDCPVPKTFSIGATWMKDAKPGKHDGDPASS